jgi:hypothetical protein
MVSEGWSSNCAFVPALFTQNTPEEGKVSIKRRRLSPSHGAAVPTLDGFARSARRRATSAPKAWLPAQGIATTFGNPCKSSSSWRLFNVQPTIQVSNALSAMDVPTSGALADRAPPWNPKFGKLAAVCALNFLERG